MGMKVSPSRLGLCEVCMGPVAGGVKYHPECSPGNKYHARGSRVTIDGREVWFASVKEMRRYLLLHELQKGGGIKNLRRQVPMHLAVNGVLVATYYADIVYEMAGNDPEDPGKEVIEDVKGVRTELYKLKKKLFEALTGKTITEV